jgi:leucyl-tRNA synthetase
MYSKTDTVTVEGGGIDDLVNLFRGLRKDMGDQKAETARMKAETARLNRLLFLEEENRKDDNKRLTAETSQLKAETARLNRSLLLEEENRKDDNKRLTAETSQLKAETARLNRSLLLEEENRKDDNKRLTAETSQLKAAITKERGERKAVVVDLEGIIERQGARLKECERELRNAKEQHDNDMRDISEVCTNVLYPFSPHLSSHMSILAHPKVGPHPPPNSFGQQP